MHKGEGFAGKDLLSSPHPMAPRGGDWRGLNQWAYFSLLIGLWGAQPAK